MGFEYKNGQLFAESMAVKEIAKQVGTPFYCYSKQIFTENYNSFASAFSAHPTTICFAVKSNSNISVLKLLGELGAGADTVSEGEIRRALIAGINPEKIVFSGVGKTVAEMKFALDSNIGQFNIESHEELSLLNEIAGELGKKALVSLRVNPDVDANTHEKITTGRKIDKFGIAYDAIIEAFEYAETLPNIKVCGIAAHIGSQITELEPFKLAFKKIVGLVSELKGKGINLSRLDFGGGVGIKYKDETPLDIKDYADALIEIAEPTALPIFLEPGRRISADAGILVSEVQFLKDTGEREFAIIDAAMNDLARPAIYTAYHEIIAEKSSSTTHKYDVVGPICESSDIFGRQRPLPELKSGDLLAIMQSGAYGMVMASTYNTRPTIPEILVDGDSFKIIRKRQTMEDLLALDEVV